MNLKLNKTHFITTITLIILNIAHQTQAQPSIYGYKCSQNTTKPTYPCQTYVLYRPESPDLLDLATIGDLFNVSRLSISKPSNILTPSYGLRINQPVFIPVSCGCHPVTNRTLNFISYANMTYTIKKTDTFYYVSTHLYGNLTTYQSVEVVNPTLIPENLEIGSDVYFPVFCKCPSDSQSSKGVNFLVSYVFQPTDTVSSVAALFGVSKQSIIDINGNNLTQFDTVFVPVSKLPKLNQPPGVPPQIGTDLTNKTTEVVTKTNNKGAVVGLGIGLGICVLLLVLVSGVLVYRESWYKKKMKSAELGGRRGEEGGGVGGGGAGRGYLKELEQNLILADVSETLDKYKVFEIGELKKATDGFNEKYLIQGSVYKGSVDGRVFAIKKMKWNAYEELKILQKVNHGNLVRLEGFCIDPEDASCYLVYEYIENGSVHSWLHETNRGKLNWRARLRIAIDVANGLQYIHEHTRPQVVHKDIKSSNILLDSNMRAKIANFGLAKSGCNAITMHIVGTQGYIAPEYLTDGVVSPKMDVFAFGVVLLELLSGREAIDEEGNVLWSVAHVVWEGTEDEKVSKMMDWIDQNFIKESCSVESLTNMMSVAVACVNKDPSKRPSMVDVVYTLCKSDDLFYDISGNEFSSSPLKAR
ncbi:hypothetical protein RND81_04G093800 [Saponaria officinalis]|uniref:Protein kinase domain-containing protein n=1 Tax=Saponaria officinalis TaxID=3572 RepID=A0AAW1LIY5_SAPOF